MSGKTSRLSALASLKQLLIPESELNRAQMAESLVALTADVRAVTHRAKSIGSIAASVAALTAGLAAFQRGQPADSGAKPSWLQGILKGAGLISSVWLAFNLPGRNQKIEGKSPAPQAFGK